MKGQLKLLHEQVVIGLITTVALGLVSLLYPWPAIFWMAVFSAGYCLVILVIEWALALIHLYTK